MGGQVCSPPIVAKKHFLALMGCYLLILYLTEQCILQIYRSAINEDLLQAAAMLREWDVCASRRIDCWATDRAGAVKQCCCILPVKCSSTALNMSPIPRILRGCDTRVDWGRAGGGGFLLHLKPFLPESGVFKLKLPVKLVAFPHEYDSVQ